MASSARPTSWSAWSDARSATATPMAAWTVRSVRVVESGSAKRETRRLATSAAISSGRACRRSVSRITPKVAASIRATRSTSRRQVRRRAAGGAEHLVADQPSEAIADEPQVAHLEHEDGHRGGGAPGALQHPRELAVEDLSADEAGQQVVGERRGVGEVLGVDGRVGDGAAPRARPEVFHVARTARLVRLQPADEGTKGRDFTTRGHLTTLRGQRPGPRGVKTELMFTVGGTVPPWARAPSARSSRGRSPPTSCSRTRWPSPSSTPGPLFPGHVLLVPRGHHETLTDLPVELVGPIFERAQRLAARGAARDRGGGHLRRDEQHGQPERSAPPRARRAAQQARWPQGVLLAAHQVPRRRARDGGGGRDPRRVGVRLSGSASRRRPAAPRWPPRARRARSCRPSASDQTSGRTSGHACSPKSS